MTKLSEYQLSPRRKLLPGTRVQLKRLRGDYIFVNATISNAGTVSLNFVGGPPGHREFRSVRPDRVKLIRKVQPS